MNGCSRGPYQAVSCPFPLLGTVSRVWFHALTAPTSAVAVHRALLILPTHPFPAVVSEHAESLDRWIQRNVACVVRACDHLIPAKVSKEIRFSDNFARRIVANGVQRRRRYQVKGKTIVAGVKRRRDSEDAKREALKDSREKVLKRSDDTQGLSAEDRGYAETLALWAHDAQSLTTNKAPIAALDALRRTSDAYAFLEIVFTEGVSDESIGALSECILQGGEHRVVSALVTIVLSKIKELKRAASRVLVSCVQEAGKVNERAMITGVFENGLDIGDVAGEVMSKLVRDCLSEDNVELVMQQTARGKWGKGGVKIMQELVSKCPKNVGEGTVAALVDGLDRNIESREKCLQFAKLLWTIVQKFPHQAKSNLATLERVLRCSQVFLAQRALVALQKLD